MEASGTHLQCIAVDGGGGGQRFRARLSDGEIFESEYPSFTLGEGSLTDNYCDRFRTFLRDAQVSHSGFTQIARIVMTVAALPGSQQERQELMDAILQVTGADELWLTSDITAAHFGTIKGDGLIITIGTGIGALATGKYRTQLHELTGDSYLIGDEGSAYWIGKMGLNRALRHKDGRGGQTLLLTRACEFFETDSDSLADYVTALERPVHRIAQFAPVVTALAAESDEVADSIIELAVSEFLDIVRAARGVLGADERFKILFSGGAIPKEGILFQRTQQRLQELGLTCDHSDIKNIDGAFALAQEKDPGIYADITDISYRK